MINFIDVERNIEESMVRGLRAIFTQDPDFTVDPDDLVVGSKIQITSQKPRTPNWERPHLYISNISYTISDAGLNRGFESDIMGSTGGEKFTRVHNVNFSLSLVVSSLHSSTSKKLSNRVVDWLWIIARDFFEDNLQIRIARMRKSPGGRTMLSESDEVFTETIAIEGLTWIRTTFENADLTGILEKIKIDEDLEGSVFSYEL